jgi:DNA polymerase zeta
MEAFPSEEALLSAFVEAVRSLDPDILVGFEVQQSSLGFLVERASTLQLAEPLLRQLSRTPQVWRLCTRPSSLRKHLFCRKTWFQACVSTVACSTRA